MRNMEILIRMGLLKKSAVVYTDYSDLACVIGDIISKSNALDMDYLERFGNHSVGLDFDMEEMARLMEVLIYMSPEDMADSFADQCWEGQEGAGSLTWRMLYNEFYAVQRVLRVLIERGNIQQKIYWKMLLKEFYKIWLTETEHTLKFQRMSGYTIQVDLAVDIVNNCTVRLSKI